MIRLTIGRVPFVVYALAADELLRPSGEAKTILDSASTGNAVIVTCMNFPLFPLWLCIILVKLFRKNAHEGYARLYCCSCETREWFVLMETKVCCTIVP